FYNDQEILALARGDLDALPENDENVVKRFESSATWGRRTLKTFRQSVLDRFENEDVQPELHSFIDATGESESMVVSSTPYALGLAPTFVGHTVVGKTTLHQSHLF